MGRVLDLVGTVQVLLAGLRRIRHLAVLELHLLLYWVLQFFCIALIKEGRCSVLEYRLLLFAIGLGLALVEIQELDVQQRFILFLLLGLLPLLVVDINVVAPKGVVVDPVFKSLLLVLLTLLGLRPLFLALLYLDGLFLFPLLGE